MESQTIDVLVNLFQAGGGFVDRPDFALVLHSFGDVEGFATGGGAGIDDGFARLRIEQGGDQLGAAILDNPFARCETGEVLD